MCKSGKVRSEVYNTYSSSHLHWWIKLSRVRCVCVAFTWRLAGDLTQKRGDIHV